MNRYQMWAAFAFSWTALCAGLLAAAEGPRVNQSAREIPLAYSVDVVVVGGSSGAVAAAVAAAEANARVFLAAPRPYLGDDMTATLRLWLEDGETPASPLAQALFRDPLAMLAQPSPHRIPFTYEADCPSSQLHPDTAVPGLLSDLAWGDPTRESVQFDQDVNLIVDLGSAKPLAGIHVWTYTRKDAGGYRVRSVDVATSPDKQTWTKAATMDGNGEDAVAVSGKLSAALDGSARFLKLHIQKDPQVARILLGEIEVVGPAPDSASALPPLKPWPRPMHIKRTLDQALLDAGVEFLYDCYPTGVLTGEDGQPCGIVMSNRAGRQAVVAKTIIDATERATVARLAGARFRPYPAGMQTFQRVVIGGSVQASEAQKARVIEPPYAGTIRTPLDPGRYPIIEYTLQLPMSGDTESSWAAADQEARNRTYDPDQQFTSDLLFQIPPDPMFAKQSATGSWAGAERLPLAALQPEGIERMYVLGGCADVSRQQAAALLRPLALIDAGARVGSQAAAEALALPSPADVKLRGEKPAPQPAATGDVRETLLGVRPVSPVAGVPQESGSLPVLGRYDVLVVGGGTAGAPAAIAAARQGARTLVVEKLSALGGVGTTGAISIYCQGNRVGFTAEVAGGPSWVIEQKCQWWRETLLEAGGEIWFGAIGCGVFLDPQTNRVLGAVIATPRGRGVVLADVVIDATGNADLAAAAGAACVYTGAAEFAMQGTGLPPRQLGATYTNTDYTYTDETDLVDVWHLLVYARDKFDRSFDLGQLVDTRERRRIVGDYTLSIHDQISERTFPDTIAQALTSYDTHGFIVDPYLLLRHPLRRRFRSDIPYRCLLPQGFEGLLVTGIGLSAHRDAQPIVRMQPDIQNQGYAAGVAAAMAAGSGKGLREIDIRQLQKHLVEVGNVTASVLAEQDSHPLPPERIAWAVEHLLDDYRSLAIILGHSDTALPLLQAAHSAGQGKQALAVAKVLGMLGDATGLQTLQSELAKADSWDTPPQWNIGSDYPDADQVGWGMSHLDNTLVALGRTRRPEAVPTVLDKLAMLTPRTGFSHHRAVYLALESLGDPRAAQPLAELLQQPEMGGHSVLSIDQRALSPSTRQTATRELMLARALYRCGDWQGRGEAALQTYCHDLRGHFARHANAVLAAGPSPQPKH